MTADLTQDIGAQVGQIALWIESKGNAGRETADLEKAGLPVDVLTNEAAIDGIVFYASGGKASFGGTYHGWYVRKNPHWSVVWGQRYGWDTEAGKALQSAREQTTRQSEVRAITRQPPRLSSWDKVLIERFSDRVSAAEQAYETLRTGEFVILDTETVDLSPAYLVSLTVIDHTGQPLIDTLLNPQYPISEGAMGIHGIEDWQLVGAPYFPDIWPRLCEVTQGKTIVIYNSNFDLSAISDEVERWGLSSQPGRISRYVVLPVEYDVCAMLLFAQFYGDWNERRRSYKWQRLGEAADYFGLDIEAPAHSALGDCLRTLGVLRGMSDFYTRYLEMKTCLKTS